MRVAPKKLFLSLVKIVVFVYLTFEAAIIASSYWTGPRVSRATGFNDPRNTTDGDNRSLETAGRWHHTGRPVDDIPRCSNEQRKKNVRVACERHKKDFSRDSPASYKHLMVDDRHRVLYCYVPKAGCSSWKHLMALHSGNATIADLQRDWEVVHVPWKAHKLGLHELSQNNIDDIRWKLKNYTKFIITRNPLSRLFSAYGDKFVWSYHTYARLHFGKILAQMFPDAPAFGEDRFVTFKKMVELIVAAHAKPDKLTRNVINDAHLRSMDSMCHPCDIEYDYFAKIETIEDDLSPLLRLFNATELPSVHVMEAEESRKKNVFNYTKPSIEEAYSTLPGDTMKQLMKIYEADLALFGYGQTHDHRTICGYSSSASKCC